jgi:hypothetical protein
MPKIFVDEVDSLDGKKEKRVVRVGDGSIIKLFDKTPVPKKNTDIVCLIF